MNARPVNRLTFAIMATWTGIIFAQGGFYHPGIYSSTAELEFIRKKVNEKAEPWYGGYKKMLGDKHAQYPPSMNAVADVHSDYGHKNTRGRSNASIGARTAYSQALQWVVTGDEKHAKNAIAVYNDWSKTLKSISGQNAKLMAGFFGNMFVCGAEIMRYAYGKWDEGEVRRFEKILTTVFLPLINNIDASGKCPKRGSPGCTFNQGSHRRSNWECNYTESLLAIGVFCNDKEVFELGLKNLKIMIEAYVQPTGQNNETCRDQAHAQMGLCALTGGCEIAWHQDQNESGYDYLDRRLLKGLTYQAKLLGGTRVSAQYCSPKPGDVSIRYPFWDAALNHYKNRAGMDVPELEKFAAKHRPWGSLSTTNMQWSTLTHYGLGTMPLSGGTVAILPDRSDIHGNASGTAVRDRPRMRIVHGSHTISPRIFRVDGKTLYTIQGRMSVPVPGNINPAD